MAGLTIYIDDKDLVKAQKGIVVPPRNRSYGNFLNGIIDKEYYDFYDIPDPKKVESVNIQLGFLPQVENATNKGYNADTQTYSIYKSVEDPNSYDVGSGLKISRSANPELFNLINSQNGSNKYITKEQHDELLKRRVEKDYENSKRIYNNHINNSFGVINAWDNLTPEERSLLMDYEYNSKGGLSQYPKFMTAMYRKDIDELKKESKRYMVTQGKKLELGRNKHILNRIENIYNNRQQFGGPTHLQPCDEQRFRMWFNTLPEGIRNSNDYDYRGWSKKKQDGGSTNDTPKLIPWEALKNIKFETIPDTTFTREKTGVGDIEVMFYDTPEEGVTYGNGFNYRHPRPGNNVVIYNPKTNDEQDVRLDALHIMPQDATYDLLRHKISKNGVNSKIMKDAKRDMEEDIKKYGHYFDTPKDYYENRVDAFLRNMLIEGSPEYIQRKRYNPDKKAEAEYNKDLMPYVYEIKKYLETGKRPDYILPEVTITPDGNYFYNGNEKVKFPSFQNGGPKRRLKDNFNKFTKQELDFISNNWNTGQTFTDGEFVYVMPGDTASNLHNRNVKQTLFDNGLPRSNASMVSTSNGWRISHAMDERYAGNEGRSWDNYIVKYYVGDNKDLIPQNAQYITVDENGNYVLNNGVPRLSNGGQTGLTIFIDDEQFKKGGQIHIKEKNKGKFTKQAQSAGMSVQEFARHVLAHKDRYPASTVKRANFARNATKFNH